MSNEEYKFPDEVAVATETNEDVEVEIVDDTPEKDRGRIVTGKQIGRASCRERV